MQYEATISLKNGVNLPMQDLDNQAKIYQGALKCFVKECLNSKASGVAHEREVYETEFRLLDSCVLGTCIEKHVDWVERSVRLSLVIYTLPYTVDTAAALQLFERWSEQDKGSKGQLLKEVCRIVGGGEERESKRQKTRVDA